jgi:hypothetical protein
MGNSKLKIQNGIRIGTISQRECLLSDATLRS